MTLTRYVFALVLAACALPALATTAVPAQDPNPNVPRNYHIDAGAGGCQALKRVDRDRLELRDDALALVNTVPGTLARAGCSIDVHVSGSNGTEQVGLYVSNNQGNTQSITATCTLTYNTAGSGAKQASTVVYVPAGKITKVGWQTDDFSYFGGATSIVCTLPYRAGVMRVYTIEGNAS